MRSCKVETTFTQLNWKGKTFPPKIRKWDQKQKDHLKRWKSQGRKDMWNQSRRISSVQRQVKIWLGRNCLVCWKSNPSSSQPRACLHLKRIKWDIPMLAKLGLWSMTGWCSWAPSGFHPSILGSATNSSTVLKSNRLLLLHPGPNRSIFEIWVWTSLVFWCFSCV